MDQDDWIEAGLAALERGGVAAVAVEPVARTLGVTKGSFYWHFKDRRALLEAVLRAWERRHTDAAIERLSQIADPRERIAVLLSGAGDTRPTIWGKLIAADDDPLVLEALRRATATRLEALARTLRELGCTPADARDRAALLLSAYVGLARLRREAPGRYDDDRARRAYVARVLALVLPAEGVS